MVSGRPSRTAQGVAAERAVLAGLGLVDDPYSVTMLTPFWHAFVVAVRRVPGFDRAGGVARAGLATRSFWHDAQVRAALDAGITQVATVGAGYDTRAWRFARAGVTFFEVDHPVTQADKRRRAPAGPGPVWVEADLATTNAADALRAHGWDAGVPTLFVLEGLTMYLPEAGLREQLAGLATTAAPGSRLTTDFSPPPDAGTSADRRLMRAQRLFRAGSGETLRFTTDRDGARAMVESAGWRVDAVAGLRELAPGLVPATAGLPCERIIVHKTVVTAHV